MAIAARNKRGARLRPVDQAANVRLDADRRAGPEHLAAMLVGHSLRVVDEMAKELKAGPRTTAAMVANMADAHSHAARRLAREALRRRLIAEGGKP